MTKPPVSNTLDHSSSKPIAACRAFYLSIFAAWLSKHCVQVPLAATGPLQGTDEVLKTIIITCPSVLKTTPACCSIIRAMHAPCPLARVQKSPTTQKASRTRPTWKVEALASCSCPQGSGIFKQNAIPTSLVYQGSETALWFHTTSMEACNASHA